VEQGNFSSDFMTNAINLKTYPLSETDRIVLMYSEDRGLIKGVAKGVKKAKSKLGGRMELLVANKLMLHKGRNLNTIAQAEALNTFYKTRTDMDKMLYSMYCAEVVMNFGVEDDPSSAEIFNLLYKVLETISACENKVDILLKCLNFQLKMCKILGYGLELSCCTVCSKEPVGKEIYFSGAHGGIVCEDCISEILGLKKMNVKLQQFFIATMNIDFSEKTVYDDKVDEKFALFCFNFMKDYIASFSSKPFKTAATLATVG